MKNQILKAATVTSIVISVIAVSAVVIMNGKLSKMEERMETLEERSNAHQQLFEMQNEVNRNLLSVIELIG